MDIKTIREKFPQYADVSDRELLSAVHQRYYKDIPFQEFAKTVGFDERAAAAAPAPAPAAPRLVDKALQFALPGSIPTAIAGKVTEGLGKLGEIAETAGYAAGEKVTDITGSPEAGYAANVGVQAIPMAVGGAVGKLGSPLVEASGRRLMASALKPSTSDIPAGQRAVQTLLDEGINVTRGGVEKMKGRISSLNDEIDAIIANSQGTVDRSQVVAALRDVRDRFMNQVTPQGDIAAIKGARDAFLNHPALKGISDIPVQLAQKLKQGTYKSLGSKSYGEVGGASQEAQKAMARALKEGIATAEPRVAAINAREGDLINAAELAAQRVAQQGNTNIGGLAPLADTGTGVLAFLADKNALVKSLLARALYSGRQALPRTAGQVTGGAAGAFTGEAPDY